MEFILFTVVFNLMFSIEYRTVGIFNLPYNDVMGHSDLNWKVCKFLNTCDPLSWNLLIADNLYQLADLTGHLATTDTLLLIPEYLVIIVLV